MAGHQHFSFEMSETEDGDREFGASNGAESFQIAQIRCGNYGSFIKHGIPVNPIYDNNCNVCFINQDILPAR